MSERYLTDDEARDELYAEWLPKHHNTAIYYGASIAGLIVLFTFIHWTDVVFLKYGKKSRMLHRIEKAVHSPMRRINAIRPWPFSLLPAQCVLVLGFLGINAALTFHDHPEDAGLLTVLAQRFGW